MTLVLVLRTLEGIVIVSDTLSTATEMRNLEGEDKLVRYHIYNRKKISKMNNLAVVHAGLSFVNGRTINQIIERLPDHSEETIIDCVSDIKKEFLKELEKDPVVKQFKKDEVILSLGIVGYRKNNPFVYRIIFIRGDKDLLDIMESDDAFVEPYFGIDYFGDYEFVRLVIKAAKKENLMKPFEILTIHEAMDMVRSLLRFSIDFQRFMVEATVAFPIESAIITCERGFNWIDQMHIKKFHYDDHDDGIPYI